MPDGLTRDVRFEVVSYVEMTPNPPKKKEKNLGHFQCLEQLYFLLENRPLQPYGAGVENAFLNKATIPTWDLMCQILTHPKKTKLAKI